MSARRYRAAAPAFIAADESWQQEAACQGMSPEVSDELFFPVSEGLAERRASEATRLYCGDCPVRLRCLQLGMSCDYGTFGGYTEKDRAELRKILKVSMGISSRSPSLEHLSLALRAFHRRRGAIAWSGQ